MKHNIKTIENLKLKLSISYVIMFSLTVYGVLYIFRDRIVDPYQKRGCIAEVIYAAEPKSFDREVADYIMQVFEPEGLDVQVKAIQCFASEGVSHKNGKHFDDKAYNFNDWNKTGDYSVPQINSIHIARFGTKFMTDWKEAVRVAYQIYKERGFSAWYGKGCK